ncbi:uncharacterized protein Z519_03730 [Cladophialophora bantiana CBS 173.52]|uniref:Uncharacterized protein n=1 Tax=Cladophialophora bantiana (strain ATCC 10958 / CBS 173.52 / CDC B-1940 / NIH 8579) TaxID=1442370 RepID=A0A0D2EYU8_CLAB1|nr:uncharacterized protein Z519_03730 [Cladophialophora bantiana CBS 173.52]KIW95146.1 hypothetical protein Z519_03730 [Cladophialophora bantiana CBS 173.52]
MAISSETIVGIIALLVMCGPTLPFLWRYLRRNKRLPFTAIGLTATPHANDITPAQQPQQQQWLLYLPFARLPLSATSAETHSSSMRLEYARSEWEHHHAQLSALENGTLYTAVRTKLVSLSLPPYPEQLMVGD